jgi:hypothetical protein
MTILRELEIFAQRVCNPLLPDFRRGEAACFYSQTILDLSSRKESKNTKPAIALISKAMSDFMIVALDRSETMPMRVYVMGMGVGNTFSNLSYANWKRKRPASAAYDATQEFRTATTPLSREGAGQLDFAALMATALQIAEHPREDVIIRKGAILLFNKIARVGNASFHQQIDRTTYYDRFIDIAEGAEDKSLRKCALKIGAFGAEPMTARNP